MSTDGSADTSTRTRSGLFLAVSGDDGLVPTVLVHGSLDRSAGMLKLSRRLDSDYRVARYDRRGYGRSNEVAPPFTMQQHVADLGEVIESVHGGVRVPLLFGHSYGGNVALAFASQYPDAVGAVVIYESPLSWLDWWPGSTAGAAAADWGADPEAAAEAFMRRLVGDETWSRLPEQTRNARRAEGVVMVDELRDLRINPAWVPERVTVPVLALYGENGQDHHRKAMSEMVTMLPNATTRAIAGASHFGPNTHPDAVAQAIAEFVSELVA